MSGIDRFLMRVFLPLTVLVSCTKTGQENLQGNVNLNVESDYQVEISTRAAFADDSYQVHIDNEILNQHRSGTLSQMKEVQLPSGEGYVATAQNISEETAEAERGQLRVFGKSASFVVNPGNITQVDIHCTVSNARLTVGYTADFLSMFKAVTVTVSEPSQPARSLTFDRRAQVNELTQAVYFNIDADPQVHVQVSATRNDDQVLTLEKDLVIAARMWKKLTLNAAVKGQSDLEIQVDDALIDDQQDIVLDPVREPLRIALPLQDVANVYATYFIPVPAILENITTGHGTPDENEAERTTVLKHLVYEISADASDEQARTAHGGGTWQVVDQADGKLIFRNLTPNTSYIFRIRYYNIVSETFRFTTEATVQLPNNDFEQWSQKNLHELYGGGQVTMFYPDSNMGNALWKTNNPLGTAGAENTNISTKAAVLWRYDSMVRPAAGFNSPKAAELSTLGFYTENVGVLGWSRGQVYSYHSPQSRKVLIGELTLSDYEMASRPSSVSFDYKYLAFPVNGDHLVFKVELKDAQRQIVASAEFTSTGAENFTTQRIPLNYTNRSVKVAFVSVTVKSGTGNDYSQYTRQVNGGYGATPYSQDRIVGSVLTIDNIIFNYDYK